MALAFMRAQRGNWKSAKESQLMLTDVEELKRLDMRIPEAETCGDVEFFIGLLAPAFSFRRANGEIVDRKEFIANLAPSSQRGSDLLAVDLLSRDRAVVSSVVTMSADLSDGPTIKRFHNVRLFVRAAENSDTWTLLAWANEFIPISGQPAAPADHLYGRERNQDLELWKHHASTGGDDKSKMVTVASWLLGFATALLSYITVHYLFSENVPRGEWLQAAVVSSVGAGTSFAAAYVAVLYGGYANRNWRAADILAWRQGWLDLLPAGDSAPGTSLETADEPKRFAAMRRRLNRYAWRYARPTQPDRYLAPVFEVYFMFALLTLAGHLVVVLWAVVMVLSKSF